MSGLSKYRDREVDDSFSPPGEDDNSGRNSVDSTSTTSLILERIHPDGRENSPYNGPQAEKDNDGGLSDGGYDPDVEKSPTPHLRPMEKKARRAVYIVGGLLVGCWLLALAVYLSREAYRTPQLDGVSTGQHLNNISPSKPITSKGKPITLEQIQAGSWSPVKQNIVWIDGEQDGLMLVASRDTNSNFLEIHNVKDKKDRRVLMKERMFTHEGNEFHIERYWPSPDLKYLLVMSNFETHWRHSFTGIYWIYNVDKKIMVPLIPGDPSRRVALAVWAPNSNAIAFVVDNNIGIRNIADNTRTIPVTTDGSKDLFNGIPDWVYEEEVFSGASAMWWGSNGKYLAFLRTNESEVPEYPLQYFASRPSGVVPEKNVENYPELSFLKYPKAGAPNPIVDLRFYDVEKMEAFSVDIKNDFADEDRLITEVIWAGNKHVLIRETNRVSDILRMILIDVESRSGKVVRELDVHALDGGWFEVSQHTTYVPADPEMGRHEAGYVDTVIHEGYDHLAYFTPLNSSTPILLTKGNWEVVEAPSAVDLEHNLVYFISTQRSPIERHVYSVKLDGSDLQPLTDISVEGRYNVLFSAKGGYALLSYDGPGIPWQKVIGTPAVDRTFSKDIEKNPDLASRAKEYDLPSSVYSIINVDGIDLQVVEQRPNNFDPTRKYPVLFHVYGGPGSQLVSKAFNVDFQSYIAGALEYIVVTVDGRGTGFIGRGPRCVIRGNIGHYEVRDQIEAAKIWAAKDYIDKSRIAIWGWSYGGYLTLKTLEQDAGNTFSYGMAVAPVTDWRYYDSIYTERYMFTPQSNEGGYNNSTVSDTTAMSQNVRFLIMHGVADDNVHFQNTLKLLDKLDLHSVENYDVHVFPDSDHSIYFHNANNMVYDRLKNWLIRAFNGEFLNLKNLEPIREHVGKKNKTSVGE